MRARQALPVSYISQLGCRRNAWSAIPLAAPALPGVSGISLVSSEKRLRHGRPSGGTPTGPKLGYLIEVLFPRRHHRLTKSSEISPSVFGKTTEVSATTTEYLGWP